ncbi:MAG: class I SAM-dependent methyltransferase [Haliea sp.]|uniref:class I SAM-dependent methyltransferase n=1 Tax=Haliea sp. TaxID=1932666 RepID=UPI0032EB499D
MNATTEEFAGQVVGDIAATLSGVMTNIGHKLGLYAALAENPALSSHNLAEQTKTDERYVREWLNNQVAGGYVTYDRAIDCYSLPDHHIPVLVDQDSPMFLIPALEVAASLWFDESAIASVFRTGDGIAWGDHHHRLFCGSESLFRPGYRAFLTSQWLDSLDGVREKLTQGARVADVGCGHGASTIALAKDFPRSQYHGYDSHPESIETARSRAADELGDHGVTFEVRDAKNIPELDFDLICFMDCLHDMGDPLGAAQRARRALAPDGTLLLVEPAAMDNVADNINPVSRMYYAASTAVCTPCSKSQEVGLALGAQAGPERLSKLLKDAGFSRVHVATSTPFNLVIEARL